MTMTDEELIALLRDCSSDEAMWSRQAADRIEALVKERDTLKVTYEDIYADAMADAESDAMDFETDLWKLVRQYITELGFDWYGDACLEGVTADEALQHIRECMDGETSRAEKAEARAEAAEAKVAKLVEALRRINSTTEASFPGAISATDVTEIQRIARAALAEIEGDQK